MKIMFLSCQQVQAIIHKCRPRKAQIGCRMPNSYNMLSYNTSIFGPVCFCKLILLHRNFKHITPTFSINGSLLGSIQPFFILRQVIDRQKAIDSLLPRFTINCLRIIHHTSYIKVFLMNITVREFRSFQSSGFIAFVISSNIKFH